MGGIDVGRLTEQYFLFSFSHSVFLSDLDVRILNCIIQQSIFSYWLQCRHSRASFRLHLRKGQS